MSKSQNQRVARSTPKLTVEAVIIGYHDQRVGRAAPTGFAFMVGNQVVVHHRGDLSAFNLPPAFLFTAERMPKIIHQSCKPKGPTSRSLHEHLTKTCFQNVGSFRCWQPIRRSVRADELDGLVYEIKKMIDAQLDDYVAQLEEYEASCRPSWGRFPTLESAPRMPDLMPA